MTWLCTNNTVWSDLTHNPGTVIPSSLFILPDQEKTRQEILQRKRKNYNIMLTAVLSAESAAGLSNI